MLELVITACLVAQPAHCADMRIVIDASITPHQCQMEAVFTVVQWAGKHPKFRVQRWTCRYPRPEKDI